MAFRRARRSFNIVPNSPPTPHERDAMIYRLTILAILAAGALIPNTAQAQQAKADAIPRFQPGQFKWVHNIAIDSKENLYTAEVGFGRRAQKFRRME